MTWIDVSGTLKPSSMGMGPSTDQPNSRLFGAVVEGPGGPFVAVSDGEQLAHVGPAARNSLQSGTAIDQVIDLVRRAFLLSQPIQQQAGVEVAGAGSDDRHLRCDCSSMLPGCYRRQRRARAIGP